MNVGLGRTNDLIIRDALCFRWDQSVLNLRLLQAFPDAGIQDLDRFGGWRSPHDHPEQVIWNHRRRGDFSYLPRAGYRFPWTAMASIVRTRLWLRTNRWALDPKTYMRKIRALLGGRRRLVG